MTCTWIPVVQVRCTEKQDVRIYVTRNSLAYLATLQLDEVLDPEVSEGVLEKEGYHDISALTCRSKKEFHQHSTDRHHPS
jgi:hypothetical protein